MPQKGLLIINLGTPDSPSTSDVQKYLKQFLSDKNVVQVPQPLWNFILYGFILPLRSWRSATYYRRIWTQDGSPLKVYTKKQAKLVQELLPDWDVRYAMTYQHPSIYDTMQAMKENGVNDFTVIPLYPQYANSTTKSIIEQVLSTGFSASIVHHFYDIPAYLDLCADFIREKWDSKIYDQLLLSFHGIPENVVKNGDPYADHVATTTTEILKRIPTISPDNAKQVFQSKFGPSPWLKPYLHNELQMLTQFGKRHVLIATPGFVVDSLETLDELAVREYQHFGEVGGQTFDLVPCFNEDPRFARLLSRIALGKENVTYV